MQENAMQLVETEQRFRPFRIAWRLNPKMYHYGRNAFIYQYLVVCQEKISIYWGIK
jgi:hypothetical protein